MNNNSLNKSPQLGYGYGPSTNQQNTPQNAQYTPVNNAGNNSYGYVAPMNHSAHNQVSQSFPVTNSTIKYPSLYEPKQLNSGYNNVYNNNDSNLYNQNNTKMSNSQNSVGYNQQSVGYNQQSVGPTPQNASYNQQSVGPTQQYASYNQQSVGPTQQNASYNQQNVGYNQQKIQNVKRQFMQQPLNQVKNPKSNNLFGQIIQGGGLNQLNNQMGNLNIQHRNNKQQGLNMWQNLAKMIDWDILLKSKNFTKKQSDTSWVTTQQQSWLYPQPSDHIQKQVDLKFAFPNPFIKYKLIPGVDQKMALDVTAKDNLEKGLIKGNLIIWDYHGGPNQQFYIHRCQSTRGGRMDEDQFILINASTGFVVSAISITVGKLRDQSKQNNFLCVYPKIQNSPAQKWKLRPINENSQIFMIQSVTTGKVLDCQNQSSKNGTNVLQWDENRSKNQLWKILPA